MKRSRLRHHQPACRKGWKIFLTMLLAFSALTTLRSLLQLGYRLERTSQISLSGKGDSQERWLSSEENRTLQTLKAEVVKYVRFTNLSFVPQHSKTFFYNASRKRPDIFDKWSEERTVHCGGKFIGYSKSFARLSNVVIDRLFCRGKRGGEELSAVDGQPEHEEYITAKDGCFQLSCPENFTYGFHGKDPPKEWLKHMRFRDVKEEEVSEVSTEFTIAIVRGDYANVCLTTIEWYNAFLIMNYFNKTQEETNILIVDAHPQSKMDEVWTALFNSARRFSSLQNVTLFKDMAWAMRYKSPMNSIYSQSAPLLEQFREFILQSHRVEHGRDVNCSSLSIVFIWRRDYKAHPRNPGYVERKIKNDRELLTATRHLYPDLNVHGYQLDLFPMRKQLQITAGADILIGMHGAGLIHATFLPKHGGLIELFPRYHGTGNIRFQALATWRNLTYRKWANTDSKNEFRNYRTYIPMKVVGNLIENVVEEMCGKPLR